MSTINTLYCSQHESGLRLQLPAHPEVVLYCHMAVWKVTCDNCRHSWPCLMWPKEIICFRELAPHTSFFHLMCYDSAHLTRSGVSLDVDLWSKLLRLKLSEIWQNLEEMMRKTAVFWQWCLIGLQEREVAVSITAQNKVSYCVQFCTCSGRVNPGMPRCTGIWNMKHEDVCWCSHAV